MTNARLQILAAATLAVMAGLMIGAMRQETPTVDETTALAAGYEWLQTPRVNVVADHPALGLMLPAFPLLFMDVKVSDQTQALLDRRLGYPWTVPWSGPPGSLQQLFPEGRNNWYFWPRPESQTIAQYFVYGSGNDAEKLLFVGRLVQVLLVLLAGVMIFLWLRQLAGLKAGLLGCVLWAFNPVVLAYGHLILTDMGIALAIPLAVWAFTRYLSNPNRGTAVWAGLAIGLALLMKFSAVLLGPIYLALVAVWWLKATNRTASPVAAPLTGASSPRRLKPAATVNQVPSAPLRDLVRSLPYLACAAWLLVLLVYFPLWSPAPSLTSEQAARWGVPGWFATLRPVLLPRDWFKGLALILGRSSGGQEAYLCGEWRHSGWWYYFPLAVALKTPVSLLLMIAGGLIFLIRDLRRVSFQQLVPWIAAAVYLLCSMISSINIGVRHVLPICPLVAVGVAERFASVPRKWQIAGWVLSGWLAVVAVWTYPFYIQYFNEFAGGPSNGYRYLIDSNFDWGQDGLRLKDYLKQRSINHIYLDYFGTQMSIDYHGIPNTRVTAETAKQIKQGYLVVSASQLMREEWAWLRQSRQPIDRVAYTLFVYQLP